MFTSITNRYILRGSVRTSKISFRFSRTLREHISNTYYHCCFKKNIIKFKINLPFFYKLVDATTVSEELKLLKCFHEYLNLKPKKFWKDKLNYFPLHNWWHTVGWRQANCRNICKLYKNKFLTIKPTRCTYFSNLFLKWNSTCFGQFLCPSSGVFHCTHSNGIHVCHTGLLTACEQDQDGTPWVADRMDLNGFHPDPACKM